MADVKTIQAIIISVLVHLLPLAGIYFLARHEVKSAFPQEGSIEVFAQAIQTESKPVEVSTRTPVDQGIDSTEPQAINPQTKNSTGIEAASAEPPAFTPPAYPPLSRRLGEEGEIKFLLLVSENGEVQSAKIEKTSGFARLDKAASDWVSKQIFPRGGSPERKYTVIFRIKN